MADDSQLLIRLRLTGGAATRAELVTTGKEVEGFGDKAEVSGKKVSFAAEKNFLLGESLYSLKRYAFFGITAIGATGAEVLKMGYDFDEAKAKTTDTLTSLVGGARAASIEVSKLIGLTHDSGLGLGVLGTAATNMLRFGFSVKQTNDYLGAFAMYSQKNGLGSGGVDSFSSIFQNVHDTGFFTSRNLHSLQALGVPGGGALGKELGLTPQEWYEFTHGQGQITASTALPAIAAYLNSVSSKQSAPLGMQFDRIRSFIAQGMGALGTPIFGWLDKEGDALTKKGGFFDRASKGAQAGGTAGMLKAIDPSGGLLGAWKALGVAVESVVNTLRALWAVLSPFVLLFVELTGGLLGWIGNSKTAKVIIYTLITAYLLLRGAQLAWLAVTTVQIGATKGIAAAMLLYDIVTMRAAYAAAVMTKAQILLDAAMDANPIGLVIVAIALLAAGFYLLYTHSKTFRDFVGWMRANWPLLAEVIAAPFTFGLSLALTHLQTIWDFLKMLYNWVDNHVFKLVFHIPGQGLLGDVTHPLRTVEHVVGHPLSTAESVAKADPVVLGGVMAEKVGASVEKAVAKGMAGHKTELSVGGVPLTNATSKAKLKVQARG